RVAGRRRCVESRAWLRGEPTDGDPVNDRLAKPARHLCLVGMLFRHAVVPFMYHATKSPAGVDNRASPLALSFLAYRCRQGQNDALSLWAWRTGADPQNDGLRAPHSTCRIPCAAFRTGRDLIGAGRDDLRESCPPSPHDTSVHPSQEDVMITIGID